MPFKLNLAQPSPKLTATEKARKEINQVKGYESPVGWWEVTTEGDVEGRSITQLGNHYGHVAEIAFALADKCSYSLNFKAMTTPITDEEGNPIKSVRKRYKATNDKVWISLDLISFSSDSTHRVTQLTAWLDTDDIEVHPNSPQASYYGASFLKLKKIP